MALDVDLVASSEWVRTTGHAATEEQLGRPDCNRPPLYCLGQPLVVIPAVAAIPPTKPNIAIAPFMTLAVTIDALLDDHRAVILAIARGRVAPGRMVVVRLADTYAAYGRVDRQSLCHRGDRDRQGDSRSRGANDEELSHETPPLLSYEDNKPDTPCVPDGTGDLSLSRVVLVSDATFQTAVRFSLNNGG